MSLGDDDFMRQALGLARRGLGRTAPNPSVGAVLVQPGEGPEIVGRGWTGPGGRPHAETIALEAAGARARGATLYVTLEPCAHHGQTPPCADAVVAAGVARVVCALEDPDPRVAGEGLGRVAAAGVDVAVGCLGEDARWLALGHILRVREGRPFVQLKLAVGSDDLVAPGTGQPVWVTGEGARAQAHLLRARADAILVGRGTVVADDPELTCRLPGMAERSPIRIILDSAARIEPAARVIVTIDEAPVWLVCGEAAASERLDDLAGQGVKTLQVGTEADGHIDIGACLGHLAGEGVTRLLVEGGPRVARAFLDQGLVDEVVIFSGSRPAGSGGLQPFVTEGLDFVAKSAHFSRWSARRLGSDQMTVYRRR